jgi:hypothetical protein
LEALHFPLQTWAPPFLSCFPSPPPIMACTTPPPPPPPPPPPLPRAHGICLHRRLPPHPLSLSALPLPPVDGTSMDAPAMDLQHPFVVGTGALPQRAAELVDESSVGAAEVRVHGGAGPPRRLPVPQHLSARAFLISRDCSSVPRGISGIVHPPRPPLPARKPRPAASSHH